MQKQAREIIIIRKFHEQDLEQILQIENQVAIEPWDKSIFISCSKIYYVIVAVIKDVVVGYSVIAIYHAINESNILNLAVDPLWHRRGIGSRLMQYLINLCNNNFNNNPNKLFLEVHTHNISAINLYRKFNFIEIYIRKNYYNTKNGRQDAVVMINNQS